MANTLATRPMSQSIELKSDRILDLKHTFNFSQATLIKPIHCKKVQQIIRISSHFQNKQHKTKSQVLSDFTQLGRHYITRKQYQNIDKDLAKIFLVKFFFFFLSSFPLRHSIIVNVFYEMGYARTPVPSIPTLSFPLSLFSLKLIQLYLLISQMKPDIFVATLLQPYTQTVTVKTNNP